MRIALGSLLRGRDDKMPNMQLVKDKQHTNDVIIT